MIQTSTPSRSARVAASLLCLAALALLASPLPARIEMTVSVGFQENAKVGRWTPIFVTLENKADPGAASSTVEDFVGSVEFHSGEIVGTNRQAEFSLPVELPANGRKIVTLYAKMPDARRSPTVKLLRVNGSELLSRPAVARNLIEANPVELLAVVVEQPQSTPFATPFFNFSSRKATFARVDSRGFPESWIGLEAADVVVVPRLADGLLNAAQLAALAEWVRMGGRLLTLGGQDTALLQGSALEDLLPVDPLGVSQREALAKYGTVVETRQVALADVNARPGSTVVARYSTPDGRELPLAWRVRRGLGEVHFWAYDARGAREENWIKQIEARLWEAMARQDYQGFVRDIWREKYRPMLDENPRVLENAAEPPNIAFVIGLIAVYFLVVGPLNFATLKKRRRLELAWFTIPAIVFVFSAFMYFVGWLTMGNENIRRDVVLIQAEANQPDARAETLACYFAAHAGNRPVLAGDHDALCFTEIIDGPSVWTERAFSDGLLMPERSVLYGMQAATGIALASGGSVRTRVLQDGEKPRIDEFFANQWTWNAIEAQGRFKLGGAGIRADVVHRGERLSGEVANLSDWDLQDAFIFVGLALPGLSEGQIQEIKLGAFPAGGAPVSLDGIRPERFSGGSSRPALASNSSLNTFSESIRDLFLDRALTGNSAYPAGRAFLCGFVDLNQYELGVKIGGEAHVSSRLGFAMIHLPMRPDPAGASLPYGHAVVYPVSADVSEPPTRVAGGQETISVTDLASAPTVFAIESPFDCGVADIEDASLQSSWQRMPPGSSGPLTIDFLVASYALRLNSLKLDIQPKPRGSGVTIVRLRDEAAGKSATVGEYMIPETQTMFVSATATLQQGEKASRRQAHFMEPSLAARYVPAAE